MQYVHSRRPIAYAAGAVALLAGLPLAGAASGADAAGGGGRAYVGKPEIKQVACSTGCVRKTRVQNGGSVRLKGRKLSYASKIVFLGASGRGDDVAVPVKPASDTKLRVKVPLDARTGPIVAQASARVRSKPTRPVTIVPAPPPEPTGELAGASGPSDPGAPKLETAVNRGTFFYDAPGGVVFTYRVDSTASTAVELLRLSDGAVVQSWTAQAVPPGEVQTIRWNGDAAGAPQPEARYGFRLTATGANGAVARSVADGETERDAFELRGNIFPVRAAHNYGSSGAQFGAGRSGHSHQGHDVFAKCGSRMVAARGGVVKERKFHSSAGNYVVIDGEGTDVDYFYAHLTTQALVNKGERVKTGQAIGTVGQTGNAQGCHLHFELWSGPGWYTGGAPFDPLPHLRAWDSYS
ncbi:MAG TPA: peptidoglycan DD-metalloendopeptidase family protein [Thermoleophilaceae bacterium]